MNTEYYKKYILPYVIKKHKELDEIRANMAPEKIEFLEKAQTKHLMGLLRRCRQGDYTRFFWDGSVYTYKQEYGDPIEVKYFKKGGVEVTIYLTKDEIKTELRNRPDMPKKRKAYNDYYRKKSAENATHRKGRNGIKCVRNKH